MAIKEVIDKISKDELISMVNQEFGDIVKAVVDVRQGIMAVGGELHADEEVFLSEKFASKREDTWGINLYPKKSGDDWIEFDSMVNIKPQAGNMSRGVESLEIQEKIKEIVSKLVI